MFWPALQIQRPGWGVLPGGVASRPGLGIPEIFNTDQGRQFTAQLFTTAVETNGSRMRMDGKGRALENIFIERLWRSVNSEKEMLKDSWPPSAKTLPAAYTAFEPQNLNRT